MSQTTRVLAVSRRAVDDYFTALLMKQADKMMD